MKLALCGSYGPVFTCCLMPSLAQQCCSHPGFFTFARIRAGRSTQSGLLRSFLLSPRKSVLKEQPRPIELTRSLSMRALCWHGKGDIRCDSVPDPKIEDGRDA